MDIISFLVGLVLAGAVILLTGSKIAAFVVFVIWIILCIYLENENKS